MPVFYVRSTDGNDADSGATWALAKATLAGAFAAAAAGDRIWVSQVHAETQASAMTLTSPGTAASPCEVLCGNDAAEPPTALATTATITTTDANNMSFVGFAYVYGITFNCSTGAAAAAMAFTGSTAWWYRFDTCSLRLLNTSSSGTARITAVGAAIGMLELVNTTFQFGSTAQGITHRVPIRWMNTPGSAVLGSAPTSLFQPSAAGSTPPVEVMGVDLSALAGSSALVLGSGANFSSHLFADCKLGASVAIITGTIVGRSGAEVKLVNCDSADTNYRYHFQNYMGTITQETTIIRTGGASDGTTPVSRKMVSTANSKFYSPLVSDWITYWNETLSALTITVPVLTDNVTLTDAEAWLEVEYMSPGATPIGAFASDRAASIIATPANQTTDGVSSWASAPGTPVKQSLAVAVTPAEKGLIRARVALAKASTTIYFDPLLQVT